MKDFFISYALPDKEWAEWIAWNIEEAGYTTTLQARDFLPGSNFVVEMENACNQSARMIAVLSPSYVARRFTQSEWAAAFAKDPTGEKRLLLPVRVSDFQPEGLLAQIVHIDIVGLDEETAQKKILEGIEASNSIARLPQLRPPFPGVRPRTVEKPKNYPGKNMPAGPPGTFGRFIHAQITAQGVFDVDHSVAHGYLSDATDLQPTEPPPKVMTFLWLPRTEVLRASQLEQFVPVAAICTTSPAHVASEFYHHLGPYTNCLDLPPRKMRKEEKEHLILSLTRAMRECLIVVVTIPAVALGTGPNRPDLAYQAMINLVLLPIIEMHKRIGIKQVDVRLAKVGEKDSPLLKLAKRSIRACNPKRPAASVEFAAAGEIGEYAFINVARLLAWAVGHYHNSGDRIWLALIEDGFEKESK